MIIVSLRAEKEHAGTNMYKQASDNKKRHASVDIYSKNPANVDIHDLMSITIRRSEANTFRFIYSIASLQSMV